jgi:glycerol kinase
MRQLLFRTVDSFLVVTLTEIERGAAAGNRRLGYHSRASRHRLAEPLVLQDFRAENELNLGSHT